MNIRKATLSDLEEILTIYADARAYMRENGNKAQWTGGHPAESLLKSDIESSLLHVCVEETGEILGVFYFRIGEDPTYKRIYEGHWQNDEPYGVIHRIAVSKESHGKGVASFIYAYCYAIIPNLRIDTHRINLPMQRSLLKNGFLPCGIIYLENGDARIAFQKCE